MIFCLICVSSILFVAETFPFDWPSEISSSMELSTRFLAYSNFESLYNSGFGE